MLIVCVCTCMSSFAPCTCKEARGVTGGCQPPNVDAVLEPRSPAKAAGAL